MMTDPHTLRLRVALVGAGRVGTAVAALLQDRGHEIVGVSSRSSASRERAAERLKGPTFDPVRSVPAADLYLIGAGDAAIPEVAETLAPHASPGAYACHFAGSLDTTPLRALADAGQKVCALHPVQACPDVDTAIARLPGSAWGVTGDEPVVTWAKELVREDLAGVPVEVAAADRVVWHAASVTVSNGIAALLATGEAMLARLGVDDPIGVLGPLAEGTVVNARAGGGGGRTLTGPVVRSETEVVGRHIEELRRRDPALATAYAAIAMIIVRAAVGAGRIEPAVAESMLAGLDDA